MDGGPNLSVGKAVAERPSSRPISRVKVDYGEAIWSRALGPGISYRMNTRHTVSKSTGSQNPPSRSVLIVEDERGPRVALATILRPFFKIFTAETAEAAMDILRSQRIDIMTLDLLLPDRNGMDFLRDVKRTHPNLDVIIITCQGSLESALAAKEQGAIGYLLKPFNVADLLALVTPPLIKTG
jgi:CheY-like chemotaxis protein